MVIEFLKKIAVFVLTALLLVATTSFSVSMHYCGKKLVSVKINKPSKSCCKASHNTTPFFKAPKKSCCNDFEFTNSGTDNFSAKEYTTTFKQVKDLQPIVKVITDFPYRTAFTSSQFIPGYHYTPPLITTNTQIAYQVFII